MGEEFIRKRARVEGLSLACPLGEALPDCPAAPIRQLPLDDRISFVATLSEKALDEVLRCHEECLKKRRKS